jgi:hypothetical protein
MLSNKKTLEFLRELETLLKNTFEFDDVKIIVETDIDKILNNEAENDEILLDDTNGTSGSSKN